MYDKINAKWGTADNGFFASAELPLPIRRWREADRDRDNPEDNTLVSISFGLSTMANGRSLAGSFRLGPSFS